MSLRMAWLGLLFRVCFWCYGTSLQKHHGKDEKRKGKRSRVACKNYHCPKLTNYNRDSWTSFLLQVGNDIINIEAVRFNLKTPFDRNVVTQFEHQETMLDYGFAHLGIDNQVQLQFFTHFSVDLNVSGWFLFGPVLVVKGYAYFFSRMLFPIPSLWQNLWEILIHAEHVSFEKPITISWNL